MYLLSTRQRASLCDQSLGDWMKSTSHCHLRQIARIAQSGARDVNQEAVLLCMFIISRRSEFHHRSPALALPATLARPLARPGRSKVIAAEQQTLLTCCDWRHQQTQPHSTHSLLFLARSRTTASAIHPPTMAEFVRAQIFGTTFEITSRYLRPGLLPP